MDQDCQAAIQRLERSLSRYRRGTWALLGLGGLVVLMGQSGPGTQPATTPEVVRAQRLEIVNAKGHTVLVAAADDVGAGKLAIGYADGRPMVSINQRLHDSIAFSESFTSRPGADAILRLGAPIMTLMWPNGRPLAVVGSEKDHGPTVAVYPSSGDRGKRLKLGTRWLVE